MNKNPYYRHRFPAAIISHCVWLYNSFSLSLRDIEKIMLYRGIEVTYESIRDWTHKFSDSAARKIRKSRPKASDKWHLDEVRVMIKGEEHWLWRAVDSQGQVKDDIIFLDLHFEYLKSWTLGGTARCFISKNSVLPDFMGMKGFYLHIQRLLAG